MSSEKPQTLAELDDEQFRLHAMALLERELGAAGAARFLRVTQTGSGNYTRDRHKWLKGVTVEQIKDDIAKLRKRSA